jgi:hypothetical protein
VTDEVRPFETHGIHPPREPRGGLGQDEGSPEAAHLPEAGQIDEVDPVAFGELRDVSGPPSGRAREPVHEHDRLALPGLLIADRPTPYQ